jgi:2-dehydro-3-deoxyphosphogluconate aldolase/(4S)-4-hydroxy-2-oxoglutarate aldolase
VTPQELDARVRQIAVLPIIIPQSVGYCIDVIGALAEGGARGIEIVLRTPDALSAIEVSIKTFPSLIFAGAQFAVSPGFLPALAAHAKHRAIPLVAGVQTATEVMAARAAGLHLLKFYPSEPAGGTDVLADFGHVFPDIGFMPSGMIDSAVLPKYAVLSNVASVGGTWMHSEGGASLDRAEIGRRMRLSLQAMARPI